VVTLQRFALIWCHPDDQPTVVSADALKAAEEALNVSLPDDYRMAVLSVGLPHPTIDLLHSVVEQDIDLPVVSDFLEPHEIVETTRSWRQIGLPDDLVAFASDCQGNLFCFPTQNSPRPARSVWLWDHDFDDVSEVADTFDDWVLDMCAIPYIASDD
jgi:hypothetical protein